MAHDVGPMSYGLVLCPMALSYVLRPCPMSYGSVQVAGSLAVVQNWGPYVLWPWTRFLFLATLGRVPREVAIAHTWDSLAWKG